MVMILLGPLTASAAVTEIPFELGKDHRIYVEGAINGSRPLRFLVDTGASALAVARHVQQDAKLVIDDQSENTGSDGVTFLDYSTHNSVQIGAMRRPMGAVVIDYQGRPFDAVLGWTFFLGRVLEIDYHRSVLRVHDDLPELVGYVRANVRWIDNTPAIQVALSNGSRTFMPCLHWTRAAMAASIWPMHSVLPMICRRRSRSGWEHHSSAAARAAGSGRWTCACLWRPFQACS